MDERERGDEIPYQPETIEELIGELNAEEAESVWEATGDPDGTFRYTGQFNDWWDALRLIVEGDPAREREVRQVIAEIRESV